MCWFIQYINVYATTKTLQMAASILEMPCELEHRQKWRLPALKARLNSWREFRSKMEGARRFVSTDPHEALYASPVKAIFILCKVASFICKDYPSPALTMYNSLEIIGKQREKETSLLFMTLKNISNTSTFVQALVHKFLCLVCTEQFLSIALSLKSHFGVSLFQPLGYWRTLDKR